MPTGEQPQFEPEEGGGAAGGTSEGEGVDESITGGIGLGLGEEYIPTETPPPQQEQPEQPQQSDPNRIPLGQGDYAYIGDGSQPNQPVRTTEWTPEKAAISSDVEYEQPVKGVLPFEAEKYEAKPELATQSTTEKQVQQEFLNQQKLSGLKEDLEIAKKQQKFHQEYAGADLNQLIKTGIVLPNGNFSEKAKLEYGLGTGGRYSEAGSVNYPLFTMGTPEEYSPGKYIGTPYEMLLTYMAKDSRQPEILVKLKEKALEDFKNQASVVGFLGNTRMPDWDEYNYENSIYREQWLKMHAQARGFVPYPMTKKELEWWEKLFKVTPVYAKPPESEFFIEYMPRMDWSSKDINETRLIWSANSKWYALSFDDNGIFTGFARGGSKNNLNWEYDTPTKPIDPTKALKCTNEECEIDISEIAQTYDWVKDNGLPRGGGGAIGSSGELPDTAFRRNEYGIVLDSIASKDYRYRASASKYTGMTLVTPATLSNILGSKPSFADESITQSIGLPYGTRNFDSYNVILLGNDSCPGCKYLHDELASKNLIGKYDNVNWLYLSTDIQGSKDKIERLTNSEISTVPKLIITKNGEVVEYTGLLNKPRLIASGWEEGLEFINEAIVKSGAGVAGTKKEVEKPKIANIPPIIESTNKYTATFIPDKTKVTIAWETNKPTIGSIGICNSNLMCSWGEKETVPTTKHSVTATISPDEVYHLTLETWDTKENKLPDVDAGYINKSSATEEQIRAFIAHGQPIPDDLRKLIEPKAEKPTETKPSASAVKPETKPIEMPIASAGVGSKIEQAEIPLGIDLDKNLFELSPALMSMGYSIMEYGKNDKPVIARELPQEFESVLAQMSPALYELQKREESGISKPSETIIPSISGKSETVTPQGLEKYKVTDKNGNENYNIAQYLRDNPNADKELIDKGFKQEDIAKAKEYNSQPFVAKNPLETWWDKIKSKGGDNLTIDEYYKLLKENPQLQKEAISIAKEKEASALPQPSISLDAFVAEYLMARGLPPLGLTSITFNKEINEARQLAVMQYARTYGNTNTVISAEESMVASIFAPARALYPEVTIKDITPLEWGLGAAQVALVVVPFATSPLRALASEGSKVANIADRVINSTVLAGSTGIFTTATITSWKDMTIPEKAISVAMDSLIAGATLSSLGIRIHIPEKGSVSKGKAHAKPKIEEYKPKISEAEATRSALSNISEAEVSSIKRVDIFSNENSVMNKNIEAVALGERTATIILENREVPMRKATGLNLQIEEIRLPSYDGWESLKSRKIVYKDESVIKGLRELKERYEVLNTSGKVDYANDLQYHIDVGKALGFKDAEIASFLYNKFGSTKVTEFFKQPASNITSEISDIADNIGSITENNNVGNILKQIYDALVTRNVKQLMASARLLLKESKNVPKQLGGETLKQQAQRLLESPQQYIERMNKDLPLSDVDIENSIRGNKAFIREADNAMKRTSDPALKAKLQEMKELARKRVAVEEKRTWKTLSEMEMERIFQEIEDIRSGKTKTRDLTIFKEKQKEVSAPTKAKEVSAPTKTIEKIATKPKVDDSWVIKPWELQRSKVDVKTKAKTGLGVEIESTEVLADAVSGTKLSELTALSLETSPSIQTSPDTVTQPEPMLAPFPIPETAPMTAPQPAPYPMPMPQTELKPQPKPETKTIPEEKLKLKTGTIKKTPIPILEKKKEKKLTKQQKESAIAWKQGVMYKMRYHPFRQEDIINTRYPIPDVKYYEGPGAAYKSVILKYPGLIPTDLEFDMGIQKTRFKSNTDKKGSIGVEIVFLERPDQAKHEQRLSKAERKELGIPEEIKKVRKPRKKIEEVEEIVEEKQEPKFIPVPSEPNTPVVSKMDLNNSKPYTEVKPKPKPSNVELQQIKEHLFPTISIFDV